MLERDAELAGLRQLLSHAASGRGGAALVEGEAGIGKSSLLDAVAAAASGDGFRVLRATGTQVEMAYPLGGARQLFEAFLRDLPAEERDQMLHGPAGQVAKAFGLADEHGTGAADEFALCHGFYWLVDAIADSGPLLLVIDDAQWLDLITLRVVIYMLRRIAEVGVAAVLAWRSGEPHHLAELDGLGGLATVLRFEPRPLTREGVAELLPFGHEHDVHELIEACYTASGGNPFLVAELAETVHPGMDPDDIASLGPVGLIRTLTKRLQHLPPDVRTVADAVAVLDADADVRCVADVAGIDVTRALLAVDALVAARLFSPGERLWFRHPLLRSAVYRALQPGARSIAHLAAARALAADERTRDRVAGHLLLVVPAGDGWVVDQLRSTAARAVSAGAPAAAIPLLERALAEPAGTATAEVLHELGHATLVAASGDPIPALERSLTSSPSPGARLAAAMDLCQGLATTDRPVEAVAVLREQAEILDAQDPTLALELRSLAAIGLDDARTIAWAADTAAGLVAAGVPDTPAGRRLVITNSYAKAIVSDGSAAVVAARVEPALQDGWWREHPGLSLTALYGGIATLVWTGQIDRSIQDTQRLLRDAERAGDRWRIAAASFWLSHALYLRGDLPGATDAARRSMEDCGPSPFLRRLTLAVLVQALTAQGCLEEADQVLATNIDDEVKLSTTASGSWLAYARCGVHVARGQGPAAAADAVMAAGGPLAQRGGTPPGWGRPTLHAMTLVGQRELACAAADALLGQATEWGEPATLGVALCNAGRVATGESALERLDAGVNLLENSPLRLELAVGRTELGAALRRTGRVNDARRVLTEAIDLAHRCGAAPLKTRAQEELRVAGGRPRRLAVTGIDALTPAEYRVARQAADGLTNTEVCQVLFLTRSTVEKHLSSVYRKLQITSRAQLRGLFESVEA